MKEVTRIHIAKVTYDIEIPAKKALQHYINTLSSYANDASVVEDIEIRITEILDERGVKAQGVITEKEVEAVKAQLGDPSEFISEGDLAIGPSHVAPEDLPASPRKLYRDMSSSLLGGVLSGIGTFFSVNPIWIRLIFIAVTIASAGLGIFAYILLWIVIPPARTTAQKLALRGVAVNAATIRHFSSDEEDKLTESRVKTRNKVLSIFVGALSALAALGFLIAVALMVGVSFVGWGIESHFPEDFNTPLIYTLSLICVALPFLFFALLAYAGFTARFTKRVGLSLLIIFVTGILTLATTISIAAYQTWSSEQAIRADMKKTTKSIAKEFEGRTKLSISNTSPHSVRYVESDTPRIEYYGLPTNKPKVAIETKGDTVAINYSFNPRHYFSEFALVVYGPKLTDITIEEGMATLETTAKDLTVTQKANTNLELSGSIQNLTATLGRFASLTGSSADITAVTITGETGVNATFGTVRSAMLTLPESCAADATTTVEFVKITEPTFTLNNESLAATVSHEKNCVAVYVDSNRIPAEGYAY